MPESMDHVLREMGEPVGVYMPDPIRMGFGIAFGLVRFRGNAVDPFPWDSITVIYETIHRHRIVKGPSFLVPKSCSRIYQVVRRDGECIRFDRDQLKYAEILGNLLHEETLRRQIP